MKTIQQAEAELRTAALAYAAAEAAYSKACDVERERDPDYWKPEKADTLSPDWQAACGALHAGRHAMEDAAKALAAAEKGETGTQEQPARPCDCGRPPVKHLYDPHTCPAAWAPDGIDGGYDAGPLKEDR